MSHRYRLYPEPEQVPMLIRHCDDARFIWNLALEQANLYRKNLGPTPNRSVRQHQLAEARQSTWLGEGSSSVQQVALLDFDQAMRNWWGGSHGRPMWRVKGKNEGFCVRDVFLKKINNKWASLHIPKLGYVKLRLSRPLPEKYGMARISLDRSSRWHVSFNSIPEPPEHLTTGAEVGIDRGVATTLATSDGQMFRIPTSPKLQARTKQLQRKLARQERGSKRREETRLALAKNSAEIVDRRKNWIEKVTTRLSNDYDTLILEDLKVKRMGESKSTNLNRSIHEACWGLFQQRLTDKAGDRIIFINPAFTSQQCQMCGHTAKENRESQAIFRCKKCDHQAHADFNAACNILARGSLAPSPGYGEYARVSPPLVAAGTLATVT